MKETKEIRNVKKYGEKVFTKERRNSRIKKNYNPLKVNYKIYKRGSGLYMENEILSDEVIEKLNFIERIFFKKRFIEIYKEGIKKGFNWNNTVR